MSHEGHEHESHGHGSHEPYTIPDYKIYRVECTPQLLETQKALEAQGLCDPWIRNEVWRYMPNEFGTHRQRLITTFFTGFKIGAIATVVTVVGSYLYNKAYPPKHGEEHHKKHKNVAHDD